MAFKYKVTQRCFREAQLLVPGQTFVTDTAQPSKALEPLDEETRVATLAKQAEYDELGKQGEALSNAEGQALRDQNKALQDQVAALAAQVALLVQSQVQANQAAADAAGGKRAKA